MGRKLVLVGDIGTGHDGFPPTPVTAGSPTVLIDGKPVARQGDPLAPHTRPKRSAHPRTIAEGSSSIFIDGRPAALTGGTVSCGGVVIGSASVVAGEPGSASTGPHAAASTAGIGPSATDGSHSPDASGTDPNRAPRNSDASTTGEAQAATAEDPGVDETAGPLLHETWSDNDTLLAIADGSSHTLYRNERPFRNIPEVRLIQTHLQELGITTVGRVDGKFGGNSARAVRTFQAQYQRREDDRALHDYALQVDGVVGKNTLLAMDEALVNGWRMDANLAEAEIRIRAFLRMIRVAEGTTGEKGYETLFGGESFITDYGKDWSDHPRVMISTGGYRSTAAGAYQVMAYTWDDQYAGTRLRAMYQISSFSPAMQDRYAVALLRHKVRGNPLKDIIDDKFEDAVHKCSWEWASLPPGRYGQPIRRMDEVIEVYRKFIKEERSGTTELHLEEGFLHEYLP